MKKNIWPNQPIFCSYIHEIARTLFEKLSSKLKPNVFIIGAYFGKRQTFLCIEPETVFTDSYALKKLKKEIRKLYLTMSDASIYRTKLSDILSETLDRNSIFYVSESQMIGNYIVNVILEIERKSLDEFYHIEKLLLPGFENLENSLIDSTINVFLNETYRSLKNPGKLTIDRNINELMRLAGVNLMFTPIICAGKTTGLHNLFETCNIISSLKYEGNSGVGKFAICSPKASHISWKLNFLSPVSINDYHIVRKLLEISADNLMLITDSSKVYGLGEIDELDSDCFIIEFKSHFSWELVHRKNTLMIVEYGNPRLSREKIEREPFMRYLKRIFKNIDDVNTKNMWKLINAALKQINGTLVIITEGAESESERLKNQAIKIVPAQFNEKLMNLVTSIDGAVLMDPQGTCHAIGAILDGQASPGGSISRGARYNSAVRYIESLKNTYSSMAIIVSEDGMVNLYPEM